MCQRLRSYVPEAATLRTQAPQQQLGPALRQHLLHDYVDELAGWAVGPGPVAGELIRCWGRGSEALE